jgi:hypothetical protein
MPKKNAAKDDDAHEMVHGIDAKKLDVVAINDAIERLKLKVPKKGGLPEKVEALKKEFAKANQADVGPCNNCGARSLIDENITVCPFCGVGEEVPESGRQAASPEVQAEIDPETGEVLETGTRAIVPEGAVEATAEIVPSKDLDVLVEEIQRLNRDATATVWVLAGKVAELNKSERWKERRTQKGAVAYSKFEEFVKAELGMTREYVQTLQRCHVNFTEKDFAEVGVSKLRMVLQFPKESQQEMLDKVRTGEVPGKRALEREKNKAPGRRALKAKRDTTKGKAAPTNAITVAAVEGKHSIKLNKRMPSKSDPLQPAKRLADEPWGCWDAANDVRFFFVVTTNAAGHMVLQFNVKRITPEA